MQLMHVSCYLISKLLNSVGIYQQSRRVKVQLHYAYNFEYKSIVNEIEEFRELGGMVVGKMQNLISRDIFWFVMTFTKKRVTR